MAAGTRAALRAAALIARAVSEDVPVRNSFILWWDITRIGVKSTVIMAAMFCLTDSVDFLKSFHHWLAWSGNGDIAAFSAKSA